MKECGRGRERRRQSFIHKNIGPKGEPGEELCDCAGHYPESWQELLPLYIPAQLPPSVSSSSVQQRLTNFYILLKGHFPRNTMIITPLQFHPLIPPPLHPNHHHYHPSSTIKPLNPPTLNIFWWVLWVSFIKWTPADSSPPFGRKPAALIAQNIWQAFHNHHHHHHHQQQRKRNYYVLVIPIHQQK